MKKAKHVLWQVALLVRIPNLLIVTGILLLFRYFLLDQLLYEEDPSALSDSIGYLLLVLASVLLAAAGYSINDSADMSLDRINRPRRPVASGSISPAIALRLGLILNALAILIGAYLAILVHSFWFGWLIPAAAGFFWLYSHQWKQRLIVKNLTVALVAASLIPFAWVFEFLFLRWHHPHFFASGIPAIGTVFMLTGAYAAFAFLITLIREIIKDMEDREGDAACGLQTIPVVFGLKKAAIITLTLVLVMEIALAWTLIVTHRLGNTFLFWYLLLAVMLPAAWLGYQVVSVRTQQDFHWLSLLAKLIMGSGILSMIFL